MGPAGNHEGRDRTQAKIQEKYYWPGVTKDVKNWVSLLYEMCKRYALINPAFLSVAWTYHCVVMWDVAWDSFFYTGTTLWPLPANKTKIWSSWHTSASCTSSKLWMEADWHRHGWPPSLLTTSLSGQKLVLPQPKKQPMWPTSSLTFFFLSRHHHIGPRKGILQPGMCVLNIYNHNQIYVPSS